MSNILYHTYRRLFAHKALRKINEVLFRMSLRGLGILNYENDRVSGESHFIRKVLPSIIKNDAPVFFDIGANVGNYSASLSGRFPNAIIHAFEPHPKNFARLQDHTVSSNLKIHNCALGQSQGELTLYDIIDSDKSTFATLHKAVISEIHKKDVETFTVTVETLDNVSESENISYIDFMKIDTEGNELDVLRGAANLLKNNNIGCIHFEFNEMNIISRAFFRDFRNILDSYDLYRLLPGGLLPLDDSPVLTELFAYQNIIAIPKTLMIKF